MVLKILVIDDDPSVIASYRKHLVGHEVTDIHDPYAVYELKRNSCFDYAFLDYDIDPIGGIDGIGLGQYLKEVCDDLVTVMVSDRVDIKESALSSGIDFFVERNGQDDEHWKTIRRIVSKIDFWSPKVLSAVESELDGSWLRRVIRTGYNNQEAVFSSGLRALFHDLNRDYSADKHRIMYAGLIFSRIAGYDLVKNDESLFDLYASRYSSHNSPDLAKCNRVDCEEFLSEGRIVSNVLRYFQSFESKITKEVDKRLGNLRTKRLGGRLEDRAIALACLALGWVCNSPRLLNDRAFEAYDLAIREYGYSPVFNEHLRNF